MCSFLLPCLSCCNAANYTTCHMKHRAFREKKIRILCKDKDGRPKPPVLCFRKGPNHFIIAAATFLNALTSFSMKSSVYVGCVQNEIVASASECATGQLTFV